PLALLSLIDRTTTRIATASKLIYSRATAFIDRWFGSHAVTAPSTADSKLGQKSSCTAATVSLAPVPPVTPNTPSLPQDRYTLPTGGRALDTVSLNSRATTKTEAIAPGDEPYPVQRVGD